MPTMSEEIRSWLGSDVQRPNWDGYRAQPISDRTLRVAALIAERLEGLEIDGRNIKCVFPCNSGGVSLSDGDESVWILITEEEPCDS